MNSISLVLLSLFVLVSATSASVKGLGRVIGGSEVQIESYPFIVSVRFNDQHNCGGSIISDSIILTAAHCMASADQVVLTVRVGSTLHSRGDIYEVHSFLVHEAFDSRYLENDIALIWLLKPLIFSPSVKQIALGTEYPTIDTQTIVIGWGMFDATSPISENLRATVLAIVPLGTCHTYYPQIPSLVICAFNANGLMSSCPGDSGGPLVDFYGNLLGIVSFGPGCGNPKPGVYTSVPDMIDWIFSHV